MTAKGLRLFPGCAADGAGAEYGRSTVAVLEALGVAVRVLADWNCCGVTGARHEDPELAVRLSARHLALAAGEGCDLLVNCAACYNNLAWSRQYLAEHPQTWPAPPGAARPEAATVLHLLAVLTSEPMLERLAKKIARPLAGMRLACYYGCLLVSPGGYTHVDDAENPHRMDDLLRLCGADTVDWSFKTDCCGGSASMTDSNPLPAVCARVCHHPCEDACARAAFDAPVSVRAVKRFLTDYCAAHPPGPELAARLAEADKRAGHGRAKPTGKRVAIVGSGPAGLTAADGLVRRGHHVVIFEPLSVAGGMLRVGIPGFRLPPSVLDADIDAICRLGGKLVMILYRRSEAEMPAIREEVDQARAEGVRLEVLAAPLRVVTQDGIVVGLQCVRTALGDPDESGRRRPVPVPGSEFLLDADTVITAIGQESDLGGLCGEISTAEDRCAVDERTLACSTPGVFAAGDVVTGPDTVTGAMASGRRAAVSIDNYLAGRPLDESQPAPPPAKLPPVRRQDLRPPRATTPRQEEPQLPGDWRVAGFQEVALSMEEAVAVAEAERCLDCGVCGDCRQCERVCQAGAIRFDDRLEDREIEIGGVVLADGYAPYDARRRGEYGYGRYPNVVTSLALANIRDQCAWVHPDRPVEATRKALELLAAAVAKAQHLRPLREGTQAVVHAALVVGGGLAGMVAATHLASQGFEVHLVEQTDSLGGQMRYIRRTLDGLDVQALRERLVRETQANPRITLHMLSTVTRNRGSVGRFESEITADDGRRATVRLPCSGKADVALILRVFVDKCEVNPQTDCAWVLIVKRMEQLGRLEELLEVVPPRNWSTARDGGPRRMTLPDALLETKPERGR
jgi:NADPH-dependent glutamate synthase beta subunit-like oxidoreductase